MQVSTGAATLYPDLKVILAHAGGFVPYIASRLAMGLSPEGDPQINSTYISQFQSFYFDTALSGKHASLTAAHATRHTLHPAVWRLLHGPRPRL